MRARTPLLALVAVTLVLGAWMMTPRSGEAEKAPREPALAHMVFFTLKDKSPQAKQQLVDACVKYLCGHEGTLYFSAGARVEELDRQVNDKEFDVALHLVFKNKAAHDKYQTHPRHLKFIEENKHNWAKVRVFDSYVRQQTFNP